MLQLCWALSGRASRVGKAQEREVDDPGSRSFTPTPLTLFALGARHHLWV